MNGSMHLTPARRAALVIGVPVLLALTGWTGFNAVALAGQGHYSVSVPLAVHDGTLSMHISDASIDLVPGESARLTGTVTYSLVKPHLSVSQNDLSMGCVVPAGVCSFGAAASVPPGANVNISTGTGDLTVAAGAVTGNLTLSSGVGDVTAAGITAADVTAQSDAGDITLTFTRPPMSLTVSAGVGDITISLPAGSGPYDVRASSKVGDVDYAGVPTSSTSDRVITATSDAGDVTISEG